MAKVRVFPDAEAVAQAFVQHLAVKVDRPQFLNKSDTPLKVALSGGSTPKRAYELLSKSEIDRSQVELYMVDERYVPMEDERSNEAMIRAALGAGIRGTDPADSPTPTPGPSPRGRGEFSFFPMYNPGGVAEAAADYNQLLRERVHKFNIVLLGMGDDGHTASIFPGMWPEIPLNEFCVASKAPGVCEDRITLTPRAICWAAETIFIVTGAAKAERLREVVKGRADFDRLPAQYIHHHSINCHWWVDEPAASLL